MSFGVIIDVDAPIEMYDALHGELVRRTGGVVDGLIIHVGRATERGFQVMEVWQSREHFDRATAEVINPLVRELAGVPDGAPIQLPPQHQLEFDP
ncbi:MAG: hypothetical protein U0Q19_01260 [Kineosporiaceae bacterium]